MTEIAPGHLVILVDDDEALRLACQQGLELAGFEVEPFANAPDALAHLAPDLNAVIVSDIRMPGMDGFDFVRHTRSIDPELPVVFITGHANTSMAVAALKDGAFDFLTKPFAMDSLVETVGQAARHRARTLENRWLQQLANDYGDHPLVGASLSVGKLRRDIDALAQTGLDTVLVGETGVGKELVARLLHRRGPRRKKALIAINCASLNEGNVEEVLFGTSARGSYVQHFSGHGKLEQAQGGVLLLDEVDSMPPPVQAHFLRVLEDRALARPGTRHLEPLDIHIVACAKSDLKVATSSGKFRPDLYYRLAGATLNIPPLRDRPEDVLPIFAMFCGFAADEFGRSMPQIDDETRAYLLTHDWPGNAHELRHFAFRHVLGLGEASAPRETGTFNTRLAIFEKGLIEQGLTTHCGDVNLAAESFGIPKKTLYDKLAKYQIDPKAFRSS